MAKSPMQLSAEKTENVNTKKIQEMLDRCNVSILVGFPSGRTHVAAEHTEDDKGKKKGGATVQKDKNGKAIEVADLARRLHYGAYGIPARPFLEEGINQNKQQLAKALQTELKKAFSGQSANWDKIGTMAVGAVQEFVRSDYYKTHVPNAKSTIERKGSDTPLIDGADLINSMNYIVETK